MSNRERLKTIASREMMNTTPKCPACGKAFTMGEPIVVACGDWAGTRLVHEHDAVFDPSTDTYVEKGCYAGRKNA